MKNPIESGELLLEAIADEKVSDLRQVVEFAQENDLWFGPYQNLYDFLKVYENNGIIRWDRKSSKIWKRKKIGIGDWFLTYLEYNETQNIDGEVRIKVTLDVDNEEEALVRARELWNERLNKGTHKGQNGGKYPQYPKVVYEITLE